MTIVRHRIKPVRSNGAAPNTLKREAQSAASPPGLGLAGFGDVWSHVKGNKNDNVPQNTQVGPLVAVKASDLQDRGQRTGGSDRRAPFDLTPEHPKLGPMSNVSHISFLPGVHWHFTYEAALKAGLPMDKAMELADLVVKFDHLPHSQDPDHAYMHAMRAPGETMEHFNEVASTYEKTLWSMKSMFGLAGLLHRMQDRHSPSHSGSEGQVLEWHGYLHEGLFKLLWHAWEDMYPGRAAQREIIGEGAELIQQYILVCGGCLNK